MVMSCSRVTEALGRKVPSWNPVTIPAGAKALMAVLLGDEEISEKPVPEASVVVCRRLVGRCWPPGPRACRQT